MSLLPRSLFGRLALLMAGGLVLTQLIGATLHLTERQRTLGAVVSQEFAQRVAAVHRAIDSQPAGERAALAERLSTPRQHFSVAAAAPAGRDVAAANSDFMARLTEALGPRTAIRPVVLPDLGTFVFDIHVELGSGGWLRVEGRAPPAPGESAGAPSCAPPSRSGRSPPSASAPGCATGAPARQRSRPARGLGENLRQPPLPEDGPSEVREAAQAFNAMQDRIRHGIEERERFLAAVSHDLKTPVTRMRLRSELLTDANLRERTLRDLDEMQQMLGGALDFLRGKAADEAQRPIDMLALLESLVDDQAELGRDIRLVACADAVRFVGRPQALRRAIGNLVENALKYGRRATLALDDDGKALRIVVEDEGPGIPEAELERVFEPFHRVDSSRNRETGGVGLGLAIVRQIALDHGGEVTLANRAGGGLRAELRLPRREA